MNIILYVILLFVVLMMFKKRTQNVKSLKKDSKYVEAYMKVLKKEEDATEFLNSYIEKETDNGLASKARIVKLYQDMLNDVKVNELPKQIDFTSIVTNKGKVSIENITSNSDLFIWLTMDVALARKKQLLEVVEELYNGICTYDEDLKNNVEYNIFKATYECALDKQGPAVEFLNNLLLGEYANYSYDKQLIGVFKKMAVSILKYAGKDLDPDYVPMLEEFARTQVGYRFLRDLGLLELYLPKEDIKD